MILMKVQNANSGDSSSDLVPLFDFPRGRHDLRSSPASSRYVTRSARGGLTQCATFSSPLRNPIRSIGKTASHPPTLTQARRILKETNSGNTQKSTSPLPHEDPSHFEPIQVIHSAAASSRYSGRGHNTTLPYSHNNATDVDMSISAESASISKHRLDLDNLTSEHRPVHYEPLKVASYVVPENSTNDCGRSQSNITEFVQKLLEDVDDDPEEVESALDPALEDVNGLNVKREFAPLLRSIFKKYGDITRETNVASPNILSFFMERLCHIYRQLEGKTFSDITHIELKDMVAEVGYFESQKLNVGWLRKKLEYIDETKVNFPRYLSAKEKAAKDELYIGRIENELEVYERELSDLQKKISLVEEKISAARDELLAKKANVDQNKEVAQDIKDRVNTLKHSLVDGLI
ncbi:hypothetical protein BUALT_Bualt11G0002500 [Buddleja alternifolia]|uniref:Uncharacterized protein n=1 Tax=Buddleja alternifolia TaxID=168488 RepID=A0AAV6WZH7_9LAMI|nr:hypothetical protein BUALT_Bualt11G0002500 [Buddleja alternifolia]